MPIAILVLVLVAYSYVMLAYPEYRRVGLGVGGVILAGLGAYLWLTESETARATTRIAPEELTFDQLVVTPSPRGATLTGRVLNGSDTYRLREMTIELRLHDCPDESVPLEDCPVVGDAAALARPDAPPGQVRGFSARYTFSGLPQNIGVLRYEWAVIETRATP